jgi:hypothetical protein
MAACPHPICQRRINEDHFACQEHWFVLPTDLRSRMQAARSRDGRVNRQSADYDEARTVWTAPG